MPIIEQNDPILVTGASGFIGSRVVKTLLDFGFSDIRCLVRPSSDVTVLAKVIGRHAHGRVTILRGNLLSRSDCESISDDVVVAYHLAASSDASFAGTFMNTVVVTRNLVEAVSRSSRARRFINVSSFTVYSNSGIPRQGLLDENCPVEDPPHRRANPYTYAKVKQDQVVVEYCKRLKLPYVIVRPGTVFGPGRAALSGRIGTGTFGVFLHLGGRNRLPLTFVDNCAEAIVLAGLRTGIDEQVFNIVDDDPPTSKKFLSLYKREIADFKSISLPYPVTFGLCALWEKYSAWSGNQLPPVFNRSRCAAEWKGNRYSNQKAKELLGWQPRVPMEKALQLFVADARQNQLNN